MDIKTRIRRSLARATCDKTELDRTVLRFKKCFDEASAALCGKGKKNKKIKIIKEKCIWKKCLQPLILTQRYWVRINLFLWIFCHLVRPL